MERAFDKTKLKQFDDAAKAMANAHYEICLYQTDEKANTQAASVKQRCFDNILAPYHLIKHQAHDSEEHLYRQCLANRMPNIKQEDYITCTNNIYAQRVELLMNHFANSSQGILEKIH